MPMDYIIFLLFIIASINILITTFLIYNVAFICILACIPLCRWWLQECVLGPCIPLRGPSSIEHVLAGFWGEKKANPCSLCFLARVWFITKPKSQLLFLEFGIMTVKKPLLSDCNCLGFAFLFIVLNGNQVKFLMDFELGLLDVLWSLCVWIEKLPHSKVQGAPRSWDVYDIFRRLFGTLLAIWNPKSIFSQFGLFLLSEISSVSLSMDIFFCYLIRISQKPSTKQRWTE